MLKGEGEQDIFSCKIFSEKYNGYMKKTISMPEIFKNPKYRGKHIILAAGKLYTAKTGEGAAKILKEIRKKNPEITPEIAYLPKAHSLILWL